MLPGTQQVQPGRSVASASCKQQSLSARCCSVHMLQSVLPQNTVFMKLTLQMIGTADKRGTSQNIEHTQLPLY